MVTVRGAGRGGRNQELALSAAIELDGTEGILVCSFATDGIDGTAKRQEPATYTNVNDVSFALVSE
jgi:glycerate-2-kinase